MFKTRRQRKRIRKIERKIQREKLPWKNNHRKFEKASKKDRRALIFQNRRNENSGGKKVRFMFTHNEANPPIHTWVRLCKPLLERSAAAKKIGQKIQICTKQPRNLQKILGGCKDKQRVSQNIPVDAGCSKCDKKCKVSCPMMKEGNSFKSTRTQFKLRHSNH